MTDFEFKPWPKTTRLFRDIVITEKLDGTNSAIQFLNDGTWAAQSRKRLITPEDDNYGFAGWVSRNSTQLFDLLGPGTHFGEWWGLGIQRKYNMDHKVFSLFNTIKWAEITGQSSGVEVAIDDMATLGGVPTLYEGTFDECEILEALSRLRIYGSVASSGFMNPEGICVFHTQSRIVQKVTLDKEDRGKWED